MLTRVLKEIDGSQGSLNLNDLERRLGIERSALDGMLQYLVQTGRLVEDEAAKNIESDDTCSRCSATCPAPPSDASFSKFPKTYSISVVRTR